MTNVATVASSDVVGNNINSRRVYFGENEDAYLAFVDTHWNRIICSAYVTDVVAANEPAGWVVVYAMKETQVVSHPLSNSFEAPEVKPARKSRARS